MEKIYATIERTSDGFSIYTENSLFSGMGETQGEAKQDMMEQIEFYLETCEELGREYPKFLKDGDYEIYYKFDVQSLLEYYQKIISKSALEKLTGINQKQLGNYASGRSKPRPAQVEKIETALHNLGSELLSISL